MSNNEIDSLPLGPEPHPARHLLSSWVNRRPALQVNAPSITQHLGFWIPDHYASPVVRNPTNPNEFISARKIWVDKVQEFREALEKHLEASGIKIEGPKYRPLNEDNGRRYQAVRLNFDWHLLPASMNLELHHEYFTVTTTLDLSRLGSSHTTSRVTPIHVELVSALLGMNKILKDRDDKISAGKNPKVVEHQASFMDPYKVVYGKAWKRFHDEVLLSPLHKMGDHLGKALMDFRGLIVSKSPEENEPKGEFLSPPGRLIPVNRDVRSKPFDQNTSLRYAHTILPFMTAGVTGMEHTISRFLDGRCIYASALGTRPPELGGQRDQPVTYLVMSSHGDRNQLGRLVDRLHLLGSVRIAALYDLPLMTEAGDELHKLEEGKLEGIGKILHRAGEGTLHDQAIKQAERATIAVSADLLRIKDTVKGGLPYRVERSRYYRRQFNDLVSALRIGNKGRIEGFQPYDQFVRHRLGNAYDFIDMVGVRYDRLQRTTNEVNQHLRTAETAKQTSTVATLQDRAEKAFWVALMPYYVSNFWLEFLDKNKEPVAHFLGKEIPLKPVIMGGVFAIGFAKAGGISSSINLWKNAAKAIANSTKTIGNNDPENYRRSPHRTQIKSLKFQKG